MRQKLNLIAFLALVAGLVVFFHNYPNKTSSPQQRQVSILETLTVPPQFEDKNLFLTAIKLSKTEAADKKITGITVPHHLLAKDLIADAFKYASKTKPKKILLLSPDHFNLGQSNISVSQSDFSTVFGLITTDSQAAQALLKLKFVHAQDFFYREHGLGALLPFIKYYFPDSPIIALTFKESTPKAELDEMVKRLKTVIDQETLIIQSTDFSHYLTAETAAVKDQSTLEVLQSRDEKKLFNLNQSDNLDSIASQYVQMRLQNELFSSNLKILAHKNSQDYTIEKLISTTSYIVQIYERAK